MLNVHRRKARQAKQHTALPCTVAKLLVWQAAPSVIIPSVSVHTSHALPRVRQTASPAA